MPTFFFRNTEMKGAPSLREWSRFVAALLHLSIPFWMYSAMYQGWVYRWLTSSLGLQLQPLDEQRKLLYLTLDVYYSVRWAVGMLVMQGELTLGIGMFVSFKHLLLDECGYIVASMITESSSLSGPLTLFDYLCAAMMIVAGILQHGSELQRYFFKRNSWNKGKIHTSGLFAYARGINHTGHMLRDLAHVLLVFQAGNHRLVWGLTVFYIVADFDLSCTVVPETQQHMRQKYGEQWEKYEKSTSYLFIPGVY